jgi:hypothetical protein
LYQLYIDFGKNADIEVPKNLPIDAGRFQYWSKAYKYALEMTERETM